MPSRIVFLLSILPLVAAAQAPSNWENVRVLAPGTQIRVAADPSHKPVQGALESVTDNALVLRGRNGPQSFARPQIGTVSVRKGHRVRNALIGLGVGTAAGVLIGFSVGHIGCKAAGGWCDLNEGVGAAIGGAAGLLGGSLGGVFWPGGWREIYVP